MAGLTLLEIVVGCLVLSLCVLPLFRHFSQAQDDFQTIVGRNISINAADEILQQIEGMRFTDLPALQDLAIPASATEFDLQAGNPATRIFVHPLPAGFVRHLTIRRDAGNPLAEAVASISWSASPRDHYEHGLWVHDLSWSTCLPRNPPTGEEP